MIEERNLTGLLGLGRHTAPADSQDGLGAILVPEALGIEGLHSVRSQPYPELYS